MKMVRLGEVGQYVRGVSFKPSDKVPVGQTGSVVCMRTANIQARLDVSDLIAIPAAKVGRKTQFLQDGDILISSANSSNLVGRCVQLGDLGYQATAGGFIAILRASQELIAPQYLYRWLSSSETQQRVRGCASKTTNIANIKVARFLQLEIPLPPLPEQRRIAAILDKADEIRRKRRESLGMLEQLVRSTFLEMFGDPVQNERGWETQPLGILVDIIGGGTPSRKRKDFFAGEIPWATSKDMGGEILRDTQEHVTQDAVQSSATKLVPSGTILVVVKSKILARRLPVALTAQPTCFSQDLKGLVATDQRISSLYLARHLRMGERYLLAQARGVNTEGLTLRHLRDCPIMIPPKSMVAAWDAFEGTCRQVNSQVRAVTAQADTLFNALSQRAFRGEL